MTEQMTQLNAKVPPKVARDARIEAARTNRRLADVVTASLRHVFGMKESQRNEIYDSIPNRPKLGRKVTV